MSFMQSVAHAQFSQLPIVDFLPGRNAPAWRRRAYVSSALLTIGAGVAAPTAMIARKQGMDDMAAKGVPETEEMKGDGEA